MSEPQAPGPRWTREQADDQLRRQVRDWFTYHPPRPEQIPRYERLRNEALDFALTIVELCPPSADRTAAIRLLRECVMTANASVACEPPPGDGA